MGDWKQLFLHEVMHWPILFGVGAMAGILKKIPCCTDHGKLRKNNQIKCDEAVV